MKKFKLFWLDGKTEEVTGETIANAFNRAGYGSGALGALDYWKEVEVEKCIACNEEIDESKCK